MRGVFAIYAEEGPKGLALAATYLVRRSKRIVGESIPHPVARTLNSVKRLDANAKNMPRVDFEIVIRNKSTDNVDPQELRKTIDSVWREVASYPHRMKARLSNSSSAFPQEFSELFPTESAVCSSFTPDEGAIGITWFASPGDVLITGALDLMISAINQFPDSIAFFGDHFQNQDGIDVPIHKPVFDEVLWAGFDYIGNSGFVCNTRIKGSSSNFESFESILKGLTHADEDFEKVVHVAVPLFRLQKESKDANLELQRSLNKTSVTNVTIIIPTRDRLDLLVPCLESISRHDAGTEYDILIVDNGSLDKATVDFLENLPKDTYTVMRDDGDFNFSRLNNRAAAIAKGPTLCLLNNDTEVLHDGWLGELVSDLCGKNMIVGPTLVYPDDSIQHAGVILGLGGIADNALRGALKDESQQEWALHKRRCSAVTAACLVIQKKDFIRLGGFRENLAVGFNDVDLCLRAQTEGGAVLYNPDVRLVHKESKTRGVDTGPKAFRAALEVVRMLDTWGNYLQSDAYYNPNLSLDAKRSFRNISEHNPRTFKDSK